MNMHPDGKTPTRSASPNPASQSFAVSSPQSDDATARHAPEMGAKDYFLKPCDISLIIRTFEFHFAKKHR